MNKLFELFDRLHLTDISIRYDFIDAKEFVWIATVYFSGVILSEKHADTREKALLMCYQDIVNDIRDKRLNMQEYKDLLISKINTRKLNAQLRAII